jgi:CheY-like chemotaxis protein
MALIQLLVIDADEANCNFLAQLLHKKNYQVRQASSGGEGIRMVQ